MGENCITPLLSISSTLDTLVASRAVTLTLGENELIIAGREQRQNRRSSTIFSSWFPAVQTTHSIPFYNILWATHADTGHVIIQYAHPTSKNVVRPRVKKYVLDKPDDKLVATWIEKLLDCSYGSSRRQQRAKVLINPFSGKGNAIRRYSRTIAPIFAAAMWHLEAEETQHHGHGTDVAEKMDIEAFDVIICCSGDGIPHEVWNGLAKRNDAARALVKIAVAQLPCGSGNAMSLNFNGTDSPSLAALAVVKGLRTPMDLASVTQGDKRILSFLSQAVGIVAEVDLGTEHLRWMGSARFTYGFLSRLLRQNVYPADIAIQVEHESKRAVKDAYRASSSKYSQGIDNRDLPTPDAPLPSLKYGTVNDTLPNNWQLLSHDELGNFYAGNMPYMSPDTIFFPAAVPFDGCLDLVRIQGTLPLYISIKTLLAVKSQTFFDLPHVQYQKVSAFRIIPKRQKEGFISIDGEKVPFEPFQVEVHKEMGTVLSKNKGLGDVIKA